jgi:hypothetical protein
MTLLSLHSTSVSATNVAPAMNVSGPGSDYIFVYRGNNPDEFNALVALGQSVIGWTATCASNQPCTGTTYRIGAVSLPDPDYLFLYTFNADGSAGLPDSGRYYFFSSPPEPLTNGASGSSFSIATVKTAKIVAFKNRTTSDTQVYIEQIGNGNTILVDQSGTVNNYVKYQGNGLSNEIAVTQIGNSSTLVNYANVNVIGNSNLINLEQRSTGGSKAMFVNVQDNNNILNAQQKDNGNHYLEVSLTGGNKNVNVLQEGSAGHMASISLSGSPVGLSLSQSGGTQQFYSITFNCATSGGCAPISVQQR